MLGSVARNFLRGGGGVRMWLPLMYVSVCVHMYCTHIKCKYSWGREVESPPHPQNPAACANDPQAWSVVLSKTARNFQHGRNEVGQRQDASADYQLQVYCKKQHLCMEIACNCSCAFMITCPGPSHKQKNSYMRSLRLNKVVSRYGVQLRISAPDKQGKFVLSSIRGGKAHNLAILVNFP